jgi:putative ABC transport system permease protein
MNTAISVLLIGFGVVLAVIAVLFTAHLERRLSHDGKGFDLVVGAKGSPLQLVLSSIYHIDIPTGNIPYDAAEKWMKHKDVKEAIPLALGDNWKGFRIVGTTPAYSSHYGATITEGRAWNKPFEVIVGADIPLPIGASFSAAHGLMAGGHEHDDEHYIVVGKLSRTGSVIDRLILTDLESVLEIHGQHGHHHEEKDHHDHDNEEHGETDITALLISVKSPLAAMNLPRTINRDSALQAANPAMEITRLTSLMGIGTKTLNTLSFLLIAMAALSIFGSLTSTLEQRQGDLAVLRVLGYSRRRLFILLAMEGLIMAAAGLALGIIGGYIGFAVMAESVSSLNASGASAAMLPGGIWILAGLTLIAGALAAALPAWRGARLNIARHLLRCIPLLFILGILHAGPAAAIEKTEMSTEEFSEEFIIQNIPDFVTTPKGGLDWAVLGQTKIIPYEEEADGLTNSGERPDFPASVKAYDGKEVIMQGYMFPLDQSEEQSQFLFGPFPLSCPYHYHAGANLTIEAHTKKPITFDYEPVTLKGTLELVARDDEFNVFYRLNNAVKVK